MPASRARGFLMGALPPAAALGACILLGAEAAGHLPPASVRLLQLAAAGGLALAVACVLPATARAARSRLRAATALAALTASCLAAGGLVRESRFRTIRDGPSSPVPPEIQAKAAAIEADFLDLLAEMERPLKATRERLARFAGNRAEAFRLLERIDEEAGFLGQGRGLSLYDSAGVVVAWTGSSYPVPCGFLDGLEPGATTYRAISDPHLKRVYALLRSGRLVLAAEATLDSRLDPRARDAALPSIQSGPPASDLRLQDFRDESTGFADYLGRAGDIAEASGTGERRNFFAGLRGPGREFLGSTQLAAPGRSERRDAVRSQHRRIAAATLAAATAGLLLVLLPPVGRRRAPLWRDAAAAIVCLWSGRHMLSWFPLRLEAGGVDLFDPSLFGSTGFFRLLRSPGDFLLTSLALAGTAILCARLCAGAVKAAAERPETGAGRVLHAVGAAVLALPAVALLARGPAMAAHLVHNSAVDLLAVELVPGDLAAVVMQASVLLGLASIMLAGLSAAALAAAALPRTAPAARLFPGPGDGLAAWTMRALMPAVVLAALVYDPLVQPATRRAVESIFEETLAPLVRGGHRARAAILSETMATLGAVDDLAERVATADDRTGASLALDLWLQTPLGPSGYNASLRVSDPDGNVVSRFSRNLPPALETRVPEDHEAGEEEPLAGRAGLPGLMQETVLDAHLGLWWDPGRPVGSVTVSVLDEFDNLPFLIPETPYARALSPVGRRLTGLPPAVHGVQLAHFYSDGTPHAGNKLQVPSLPAGWTELLVDNEQSVWAERADDGRPVRWLFFAHGDRIFALGYPRATRMERAARAVRAMLLGSELLAILLLPAAAVQLRGSGRGAPARLLSALGRTHYRKLLTTFTAAGVIPLVILSSLILGYLARALEENIEERGQRGIRSASSLMRAMIEQPEGTRPDLGDDVLYWLGEQVGNDVNLYKDGELLATSRRELFASGLLSPRMDGRIFRAIEMEGRRLVMGSETLRGYRYLTLSAPVVSGSGRREALLSLPLDAQAAEAKAGAREVVDVLLIAGLVMVLVTGGMGYLLARRVSRPIRSLRSAAARIAAGDLDAAVSETPRDETGGLIETFNSMARALKEQREDLERRKDYIEKVLRNATIGVISTDLGGRVVTANPAASAILDLAPLAPGDDLLQLVSDRAPLAALARAMEEPTPSAARDIELSPWGPDADRTARARVVPFPEGHGLILLLEDVTETVRSNRLAAWAEMARRIAHEIKNPLTPIQLSAEHIGRVYRDGSPHFPAVMRECLLTILREVANLREISAEFSAYARIPTPRREPTPLSDFLGEVLRPYLAAAPQGVELSAEVAPGLPTLDVDRSLLRRAIVNLIENALQAMPRGGRLQVRAWRGVEEVWIEVSDTGVGMDGAALGRIFEPYFSTKDAGTGLGLAIARKAVEEHGGRIEVSSAPGAGTTMRVRLPVATLAAAGGAPEGSFTGDRRAG